MKTITWKVEYTRDLSEYDEWDLSIEYQGEDYYYIPEYEEWITAVNDTTEFDKVFDTELIKILDALLMKKLESKMYEEVQELIQAELEETSQIQGKFTFN